MTDRAREMAGQAKQADTDYLVAYWRRLHSESAELADQMNSLRQQYDECTLHKIAISETLRQRGVDTSELVSEMYANKIAGVSILDIGLDISNTDEPPPLSLAG